MQRQVVRTGWYVEGRYFGLREHQARALARRLSQEYGRKVVVMFVREQQPCS